MFSNTIGFCRWFRPKQMPWRNVIHTLNVRVAVAFQGDCEEREPPHASALACLACLLAGCCFGCTMDGVGIMGDAWVARMSNHSDYCSRAWPRGEDGKDIPPSMPCFILKLPQTSQCKVEFTVGRLGINAACACTTTAIARRDV
jgi:hypothetical protein